MATSQFMIQFYTDQISDADVTEVPGFDDEAFLFLDPSRSTVVREVACEEMGGILAYKAPDGFTIGVSNLALTDLRLVQPQGDADAFFFAPSFSPSPPVKGYGLAILRVTVVGFAAIGDARLSAGRAFGVHAYVDQTD